MERYSNKYTQAFMTDEEMIELFGEDLTHIITKDAECSIWGMKSGKAEQSMLENGNRRVALPVEGMYPSDPETKDFTVGHVNIIYDIHDEVIAIDGTVNPNGLKMDVATEVYENGIRVQNDPYYGVEFSTENYSRVNDISIEK